MDPQEILKELEKIQSTRAGEFKSGIRQQIEALTTAAESKQAAVALYEDAVQAVEYEGKPKDSSEFALWREKYKDMLIDDDFRIPLQLHLQYLVMTLKRLDGVKNEELMPALLDYTTQLAAAQSELLKREKPRNDVQIRAEKARPKEKQGDKVGKNVLDKGRGLMGGTLASSVFSRWYRIDGHVAQLKDWEQSSGNIEGIVDKVIMPYMRDKKDERLLTLWDERIARAEELARQTDLAIDLEKFQTQTLPGLMWKRAEDRLVLGQKNGAILDMFSIIKGYTAHADFEKWTKELVGIIKGKGPTTAAVGE